MSILSGFKKVIRYIKTSTGYAKLSQWTSSQTVEMNDGTTLENKISSMNTTIGNKVDKVSGKGLSTNDYTTTEKNKLAGISANANNYTHPAYTQKSSGLYKITVDSTGHINGTTAVTKSDITALGIPGSDTNTVYTHPSTDGNKHIPANGTINGGKYLKATSTSGSYEWGNLTKSDVIDALGYTPGTSGSELKIAQGYGLYYVAIECDGEYDNLAVKLSHGLKFHCDGSIVLDQSYNNYGVCSTASSTAEKVATINNGNFSLITGIEVAIKFTNTNTATNPTLNINGYGAKYIRYKGTSIPTSCITANEVIVFRYDGTYWVPINIDSFSNTHTTTNSNYQLLLSSSSGTSTNTEDQTGVRRNNNLYYNPYNRSLHAPSFMENGEYLGNKYQQKTKILFDGTSSSYSLSQRDVQYTDYICTSINTGCDSENVSLYIYRLRVIGMFHQENTFYPYIVHIPFFCISDGYMNVGQTAYEFYIGEHSSFSPLQFLTVDTVRTGSISTIVLSAGNGYIQRVELLSGN